jgi:hypothetical protein
MHLDLLPLLFSYSSLKQFVIMLVDYCKFVSLRCIEFDQLKEEKEKRIEEIDRKRQQN